MTQYILVLNSGSSSLKFSLFTLAAAQARPSSTPLAHGMAENLGSVQAQWHWHDDQGKTTAAIGGADHEQALLSIIARLADFNIAPTQWLAIGHRVVHGGEHFSESVIIDDAVIDAIHKCSELAPLHNPANLLGIHTVRRHFPLVTQIAVFDTAFHQTLAPTAYLYAVPYALYRERGVRRYGFHGISHQYVALQAVARLHLPANDHQLLIAHLGNGCSATAVLNGASVDTTMGLTPLEGLVMGTRSGDVDPGLHNFLSETCGWSLTQIMTILNRESGLLGLSQLSHDMRTLIQAAPNNPQAALAIDVFCFRLARHLAGLAASLTRIDALIFTGGIGENAPLVRAKVIAGLAIFGFQLDSARNQELDESGVITGTQGPRALVIATHEEWMIAQECVHRLSTSEEHH